MLTRPIYKVDAFTQTALEGNPAGVMPFARGLRTDDMLAVARELNAPETAFVLPSRQADLKVRFFTPTQEVPSCGHALVAALCVLVEMGEIPMSGDFVRVDVETGVGVLPADLVRTPEGLRVDLEQAAPAFRPCPVPADRILAALGAGQDDLRTDFPLELAYTGLWHLLVPFRDVDAMDGLMPDYRRLASLSEEIGVMTTHVFVETSDGLSCRDFSPAAGIDEDPVSGTAAGALGAYLLRHELAPADKPVIMTQGQSCGRPGTLRVVVSGTPGAPDKVVVGGHAVLSLRGHIRLGEMG